MKTIYRYEVPIDDQWHTHELTGNVVHVACRNENAVEFWAISTGREVPEVAKFRVFGTGHEVPVASIYRGTAFSPQIGASPFVVPAGRYVWHLFQAVDEELYAATTAVSEPMPAEPEATGEIPPGPVNDAISAFLDDPSSGSLRQRPQRP